MSATSIDVHTFRRPGTPQPRTALTTIWARDLDKRESVLDAREAEVSRRERTLARIERKEELRRLMDVEPQEEATARAVRPFDHALRLRVHEGFRVRELEWWRKQLGAVPVLR